MRKSNYSICEVFYNIKCVFLTKLFYKGSRLIRTPIAVRGKKYIDFGVALTTGRNCQIEVNGEHDQVCLKFGKNVNIGNNVRIQCAKKISIGDNVLMGSRITIIDNPHGCYSGIQQDTPLLAPNERRLKTAEIVIEDNVWLGDGVVVQQGITIGKGSIVGANSVVTKSLPQYVIAAGIPARIIKEYNEESGSWERV